MSDLLHALSTNIVDALPTPVLILDADLRIVAANHHFYQTFKMSPQDVALHAVDAPSNGRWEVPHLRTALERLLTHGDVVENLQLTFTVPIIGQRTMLFNARRLHIAAVQAAQILLTIQDMTEYKPMQEAIRQREDRFQALIENSLDGIVLSEADGTMLYLSPAIIRIFGYTPDELLLKNRFDFIHPDDVEQTKQEWATLLQQAQEVITSEYRVLHKDGAYRWIECVSQNLLTDPAVAAIVGNFRDITERKKAEEELLRMELLRAKLEQEKELVELRERFISMVSHDFRTPLTIIQTSADLIGHYYERLSLEKRDKILHDIEVQIKYMVELLEDVMIVDRAHTKKLTVDWYSLDVGAFCQELLEQLRIMDAGRHRFVFKTRGDLKPIQTDEDLLRRILMNLLSNAIKYSPSDGEVGLTLSLTESEMVLEVSDQGIGIPAGDQAHLFEAFYRASNTRKIKGTGLGLAIVKASVDALEGTITYESKAAQGTTFTVRLPVPPNFV